MDEAKKGTLSKEQIDKAIKWVTDHWKKLDKSCEICTNTSWTIPADLVTPGIFTGGFAIGKAYPQFMLMCNNCGNTKYFNAIVAGIVEKEQRGEKDAK